MTEYHCGCHSPGSGMMHCMPCCYECKRCGKRIKT